MFVCMYVVMPASLKPMLDPVHTDTHIYNLKVADGCALHAGRTAGTVLEGPLLPVTQKPKSATPQNKIVPFSHADSCPFIWSLIKPCSLPLQPSASFMEENNTFTSPR